MTTHFEDVKLKVGAELDAEVWRRLFGRETQLSREGFLLDAEPTLAGRLPPLSTDLAGAWTVVEELRKRGWLWTIREKPDGFPYYWDDSYSDGSRVWKRAYVNLEWMPQDAAEDLRKRIWAHPGSLGDSVPEAICRTALMALEER